MTGRRSRKTTRCEPFVDVGNGERLTFARQLVTLPRSPTVAEILHDFEEFVLSQQNSECVDNERSLMDSDIFTGYGTLPCFFRQSLAAFKCTSTGH